MKKLFVVCAMSATLACAQTADAKKTPAKPAPKAEAPKTGGATTLPVGAVADGPYAWRFTDAKGGKWIYRQTPFGLVKMEDKPEPVVVDREIGRGITVTDLGDSVHFDRVTPFGQQSWTKKKTELNDQEKEFIAVKGASKPDSTPAAAAEKQ